MSSSSLETLSILPWMTETSVFLVESAAASPWLVLGRVTKIRNQRRQDQDHNTQFPFCAEFTVIVNYSQCTEFISWMLVGIAIIVKMDIG